MLLLQNWAIRSTTTRKPYLCGEIYGHPTIKDGTPFESAPGYKLDMTRLEALAGGVAYNLGRPATGWIEWLVARKNNDYSTLLLNQ